MGLKKWSWFKKEKLPPKRRESVTPLPVEYDPNSHRPAYLHAFDEFKQRGSLYNQLTIRKENEETSAEIKSNLEATKQRSLSNEMARSMLGGPFREKTANSTLDTENNNLHVQNESSSIASSSSSAPTAVTKIEEGRQRACYNLFNNIRPNARTNSSNSSGAYRPYDLDSRSSGDEEKVRKISTCVDIPDDSCKEIVKILGDMVKPNGACNERRIHNSPVLQPLIEHGISGISPLSAFESLQPLIEHGISGISPLSAFESFRRCENVVDDSFDFLNDTDCKQYFSDEESESCATSPLGHKHPVYVIECRAKDITPTLSGLRSTISTPFRLSSGSFRHTDVTLRKCCPLDSASKRLVRKAFERDFEILSKVKHPNIVILMAACFNRKPINDMTLVMENVDCTLHFHLHQLGEWFTLIDSIGIVQQISRAALYLQECGYIHSNITSHNVLYRELSYSVKLSSFELATDVDYSTVRAEIENYYPQPRTIQPAAHISSPQSSTGSEEDELALKKRYKEPFKRPLTFNRSMNAKQDYMGILPKYLMYNTSYRQHLSIHNVTAPELLAVDQRFVFPKPKTDVYSLCLLLWELLNKCVPFAEYNRFDMERMIENNEMNLPFSERGRCYFFMDIFAAGLAIQPENRTIDLSNLIEQLENIELEILTAGEGVSNDDRNNDSDESKYFDETVTSSPSRESEPLSGNHVNSSNFILFPSSLNFDKSLKACQRTSTKKIIKKPSRNGHPIRELFPPSINDKDGDCAIEEQSCVVELNDTSIKQQPNDVRSAPPIVVGFSVKRKNDSETYANLLETPLPTTTAAAKKLFYYSPYEYNCTNSEERLPNGMPNFARQNYIKRKAWLSSQEPNGATNEDNEAEHMVDGNNKEAEVNKTVNLSVRIIHNKRTPEKATRVAPVQPKEDVDQHQPSILSKIQFFNSGNPILKTTSTSLLKDKSPVVPPVKVGEVVSNNNTTTSLHKITNERVVTVASGENGCPDKNVVAPSRDERIAIMSEITKIMQNLHNRPLNLPQKKELFEKKQWKRELDICNRSLNSIDGCQGSKFEVPKFRSVRDVILKFEKCCENFRSQSTSNSSSTSNELVKTTMSPKPNGQTNHGNKQSDSSTMIKRTHYSERNASGIVSPTDNAMFDKFIFCGENVATRMSLRQVRQTSSDVAVTNRCQMGGKTDARYTNCGRKIDLASRMSTDELRALTYEHLNISVKSDSHLLQESPTRRCQARVNTQDTRFIEDFYIDDDFVNGLGVDMELQSNGSLDFGPIRLDYAS